MGSIILVTGGARSGKSSYALGRAESSPLCPKIFVATAEALDAEMQERIATHQRERGPAWTTVEAPSDLCGAVAALPPDCAAVVDCLTVWMGNVWHVAGGQASAIRGQTAALVKALQRWRSLSTGTLWIVTNEVGWGIVPIDAGVRVFRDEAGRLSQQVAGVADEVYLCVCGVAMKVKPQQ